LRPRPLARRAANAPGDLGAHAVLVGRQEAVALEMVEAELERHGKVLLVPGERQQPLHQRRAELLHARLLPPRER
jgi:alkanesulfonate monooxygenase SsuD/methylene tetrahydromethanopterin reductase-like flavin-dependent oxidoreductase (luciferase family)